MQNKAVLKTISTGLAVPSVIGITAVGFTDPQLYRAIAPWVFGLLTVGVWGTIAVWFTYLISRKTFDFDGIDTLWKTGTHLAIGWVLMTLLMTGLWFLPHILPHKKTAAPKAPAPKSNLL